MYINTPLHVKSVEADEDVLSSESLSSVLSEGWISHNTSLESED